MVDPYRQCAEREPEYYCHNKGCGECTCEECEEEKRKAAENVFLGFMNNVLGTFRIWL